jgi:hypothetical protein
MEHGSYLHKECKGILRSKWQKRFFFIDRNTKALVQFKESKMAPKDRKEKLKLSDLHGVDRVKNILTIVGKDQTVLVLKADKIELAEAWFTVLDKDFAEARRARDEMLQREAAAKAKSEAEAAAGKKLGELNEAHSKNQAERDAAHAEQIAEQQKKLEEERTAREATEAAMAEQQRLRDEEAAKMAKAKEQEEEARLAAAKQEAEEEAKKKAEQEAKAEAAAKAAAKKAEAEARAKARQEEEALAKLQRHARFSGPNSIYHEAPTTWVDYPVITKNEEILLRKSQTAKEAANEWISQRRQARAGAP